MPRQSRSRQGRSCNGGNDVDVQNHCERARGGGQIINTGFSARLEALLDSGKRLCEQSEEAVFSADAWNPTTVIGHIVDVDTEVWMARFELMRDTFNRSEPAVQLSWWEPDPVKTAEHYSNYSLKQTQAALIESRMRMVTFLRGLTEAERRAPAIHKTFGAITIESMLQVILDHDDEHAKSFFE